MAAAVMLAGLWAQPASATPNEATVTLTARIAFPTVARRAPRHAARPMLRLSGVTTYSRQPQVLMVTGRSAPGGTRWVRVRLPTRPNGSSGWVPQSHVRLSATRTRIEVTLGTRTLTVWRGGSRLAVWPVGIGKPATPTPTGRFAISDALATLPAWRSVYGAHTLTLTAHSSVLRRFMGGNGLVAIHGGSTGRVGYAASNGCVILSATHLAAIRRYALPGTPVIIRP